MDGKRLAPFVLIGLFVIVAVQIGGFVLLWSKDAPLPEYVYLSATADKTAAATAAISPVVVVSPPDEKALRAIIQTVLEQELAPYARQVATAPEAAQKTALTDPPGVKENSPENSQAFSTASSIVESAVAQGLWTNEMSINLMTQATGLSRAQREKLMQKLIQAVNNQHLDLQDGIPAL